MKAGRLRALGVTSEKRDPAFPDVPTIAEAGVPGYSMLNWYGMLVPAGTPRATIARLQAETVRILKSPRDQASGLPRRVPPSSEARRKRSQFF